MQWLKPSAEAARRLGQARHGARQRGRGLTVALQLERARQIAGANQQRDGQCKRVGADVAGADAANGREACEENKQIEISGHSVSVSG